MMNKIDGKRLPSLGEEPFFDEINQKKFQKLWYEAFPKINKFDVGKVIICGTAGEITRYHIGENGQRVIDEFNLQSVSTIFGDHAINHLFYTPNKPKDE